MGERPRGFVPDGFIPDAPPSVRRPVSAEQFMTPEDIQNRDMTALDVVKGIGKGAARSVAGMVDLAAQSRMIPGLTPQSLPPEAVAQVTPEYTNDAQRIGGTLETVAELGGPIVGAGRALVAGARAVPAAAEAVTRAMLSDTPLLTQARQLAAKKILGKVLEFGRTPNAGGTLVKPPRVTVEDEIAAALDELRAPEPPARITTPPQADLPPGYTPRASAPKPKAEKPAPKPAPPSSRPQRPYFLKPDAPIAPKREAAPIGMDDLPTSWRSRTTQTNVPGLGNIDADTLAASFADELASRGVGVTEAIQLVSKNPDLPVAVRNKIIAGLMKVRPSGAAR